MNRTILLTAAGMLTVAVAGLGCEQDKSESHVGSARGETMHATGQPGTVAKHGTGTSAAGVTTGNTTTATPAASVETTTPAPAKDAGATGQTASNQGHGPGGIDQQKTTVTASSGGATLTATADATAAKPAADAAVSIPGPAAVDSTPAAQPAAAEDKADKKDDDAHHGDHADAWAQVKPSAAAPKEMQVTGTVKFAKADHGVKVMVDLKGLTPNGKHGFHIHEKGDLSDPKLMSVGGHFNPDGKKHGGPEGDERHGGDLGNLTADDKGNAKVTIMAHGITIDDEKTGIVGRSIIVHAKADDEKTDPSGNSGDRIAGGAIEKPSKDEKKSADAGSTAAPAGAAEAQPAASVTPAAAQPQEELNK